MMVLEKKPWEGKRIVILERKSIAKEELENQEHALLKFLEIQGGILVCEPFRLEEHGSVGMIWVDGRLQERRSDLAAIEEMAKKRLFDILLTFHHDRITRAGGTMLNNYAMKFKSMEVLIWDYEDEKFLSTAETNTDEILQSIHGAGARAYVDEIKKKTKNALSVIKDELSDKGYHMTKPKYRAGVLIDPSRRIEKLGRPWYVQKQGEGKRAATEKDIEEIRHAYYNGMSLRKIASEYGCSITPIRTAIKTARAQAPH